MRKQFAKTLQELGGSDERLVVLVGDISVFLLRNFAKEFPQRFYNIGICEQSMVSLSAGLAAVGFIPVVHSIIPFLVERCYEQIKLDFCYQELGVNLVSIGSAFDYAASGCTHHCYGDIAILRALPGMEITYPSSEIEFDTLFKQTYSNGHPTYFRLPAHKHDVVFDTSQIQFGKGIKVHEGKKLTIVVSGPQLRNVVEAAKSYSTEIIYIHTIKPLDVTLIRQSAQKTGKILVVEEHNVIGGMGDEVARSIEDLPGVIQSRLGIGDRFLTNYGTYEEHCSALGLNIEGIEEQIKGLI